MIAASRTPFGRSPFRSAFLTSASLHAPMPVSLSCVMLEAVTLNGGSSQLSPLERSRSNTGAPRSPFGVWQFWQVMMVLTRYLPRSTGVCDDAAFAVTKAASIKIQRICMNALRCAPPEYRRPQRITALPRSVHTKIVLFVSASAAHRRTNKKERPKPPFFKLCNRLPGSGRRRLLGRPLLHRPGVLAARIDVAVDELDDAHRRAVAMAVASLE